MCTESYTMITKYTEWIKVNYNTYRYGKRNYMSLHFIKRKDSKTLNMRSSYYTHSVITSQVNKLNLLMINMESLMISKRTIAVSYTHLDVYKRQSMCL